MNELAQPGGAIVLPMPKMTPDQEAAVAEIERCAKRLERADAARKAASADALTAALDALRIGVPPAVVERSAPFTGSYIRKMARNAGIKGDPKYDRTQKHSPESD